MLNLQKYKKLFREFDTFDFVWNMQKKKLQVVLCKIPIDKRKECGMPIWKRCYACFEPKSNVWTIESGDALRQATIFEKF